MLSGVSILPDGLSLQINLFARFTYPISESSHKKIELFVTEFRLMRQLGFTLFPIRLLLFEAMLSEEVPLLGKSMNEWKST